MGQPVELSAYNLRVNGWNAGPKEFELQVQIAQPVAVCELVSQNSSKMHG